MRLRQPEPGVQRRQQVDRGRTGSSRRRRARSARAPGGRPCDRRAFPRLVPAAAGSGAPGRPASRPRSAAEHPSDDRRGPVRPAVGGAAVAAPLPGRRRARRRRRAAGRRSPRRADGCAGCGPRAPSGNRRRRQRAKRSIGADRERQQGRQQHELDRPAADDRASRGRRSSSFPAPARGRRRASRRGSASPGRARPGARALSGSSREALRRRRRNGRERQSRDAARDERPLLAEREREAEVEQLPEGRRPQRLASGLLEHADRCGAYERSGR